MHMHNRLASRLAAIHANIIAIRLVTLFEPLLALLDQLHNSLLFNRSEIEPVGGMAVGDDQQVALRNWKAIQPDMSQCIERH